MTIQVPGTAPQTLAATYVEYSSDELPGLPAHAAGLEWLARASRHPKDYMARSFDDAVRDLSSQGVAELLGDETAWPEDFARFVEGDGLRDRLRSATDCYFDLGDSAVHVEGGRLLHLISDSQWVFHWLLYVGDDGSSAMVGTDFPAGFNLDDEEVTYWREEKWEYVVVADSFAEFIWRWWMDNEIFFDIAVDKTALTAEMRNYVEQYGEAKALD